MDKPILLVVSDHVSVRCDWVKTVANNNDKGKRYYHPDCDIVFIGRRSEKTDHAVMLALQDCNMPVRSLVYNRR